MDTSKKESGIFIGFEGIDGAGKSSHIDSLAQAFKAQGRAITLTREPGGTPLAEKLRAIALNDAMDAMTEALIVFAARRDHLVQCIEPALARGDVVLCDRFTDSTFAYQGAGRGFDLGVLEVLEGWVQSTNGSILRNPDLTIWFDLSPEVAAKRLVSARVPDKFESQNVEFFRRVSEGYRNRFKMDSGRFARVNADNERDMVWNDVFNAVEDKGFLNVERK